MELDSIECVSTVDGGADEDREIRNLHHGNLHNHHAHHPLSHHPPQFSASKPPNPIAANVSPVTNIVGPTAIAPATSVHELLECPVCTNSMYPPIHQVCLFGFLSLSLIALYWGWCMAALCWNHPVFY